MAHVFKIPAYCRDSGKVSYTQRIKWFRVSTLLAIRTKTNSACICSYTEPEFTLSTSALSMYMLYIVIPTYVDIEMLIPMPLDSD